jgi:Flp pilus assembly protein TadD
MHNSLGEALLKMGKPSDARKHFEKALRLEPEYAKARQNLARFGEQ